MMTWAEKSTAEMRDGVRELEEVMDGAERKGTGSVHGSAALKWPPRISGATGCHTVSKAIGSVSCASHQALHNSWAKCPRVRTVMID